MCVIRKMETQMCVCVFFFFVGIMLKKLKMTGPEIRKALLTLDDTKLTVDDLKNISRVLPTKDEVSRGN